MAEGFFDMQNASDGFQDLQRYQASLYDVIHQIFIPPDGMMVSLEVNINLKSITSTKRFLRERERETERESERESESE